MHMTLSELQQRYAAGDTPSKVIAEICREDPRLE